MRCLAIVIGGYCCQARKPAVPPPVLWLSDLWNCTQWLINSILWSDFFPFAFSFLVWYLIFQLPAAVWSVAMSLSLKSFQSVRWLYLNTCWSSPISIYTLAYSVSQVPGSLVRTNATILILAQAYWVSPFWWALLFLSSWQPGSARSHKPGGCTACTHVFRAGALCTSCLGPSLYPLLVLSHWILWKKALISSYAACCVRNILPISRG